MRRPSRPGRRPTAVGNKTYPIREVLGFTLEVLHNTGWNYVSQEEAKSKNVSSTAAHVKVKLQSGKTTTITNIDGISVEAVIQYFQSRDFSSEPQITLAKSYLGMGIVSDNNVPIIVMLIHRYKEEIERNSKLSKFAQKYVGSQWVGELGSKMELALKVIKKESMVSMSPVMEYQLTFADQEGNLYRCNGGFAAELWQCLHVDIEIIGHVTDISSGRKITTISITKFHELIGMGSDES